LATGGKSEKRTGCAGFNPPCLPAAFALACEHYGHSAFCFRNGTTASATAGDHAVTTAQTAP
jgi:hypothetical protein